MRDLAEYVGGLIDRLRHTSPEMGLLRVALLVTSLLAVVIVRSWTGQDLAGVVLWLAGVLVLGTLLRPDSPFPGVLLAVLGLWWVGASTGAAGWQHVTVVALLGAVHVLAAQAGSAPSHASLTPSASFTMLVGSGAYVVVVGLAALLVVAVTTVGAGYSSTQVAIAAGVLLLAGVIGGVLMASRP